MKIVPIALKFVIKVLAVQVLLQLENGKFDVMKRVETIEEFYKRKFDWMPDNIRNEIGHFNVFKLDPFVGDKAQPLPYKRRDYFKIMLVIGNRHYHFPIRKYLINGSTWIMCGKDFFVYSISIFFISMET